MSLRSGALACTGGIVLAVAGCNSSNHVSPPTAQAYLQKLSAEQNKLAAAERRVPRRVSSPAALASAIALLQGAVHRLRSR
jgi:hypothetical protein